MSQTLSQQKMLLFHDPTFPQFCSDEVLSRLLSGTFQVALAATLADMLADGYRTLISFHGPYFPKQAWSALLQFLRAGGNLAVFGGMPFTRLILADGTLEPEQQTYTDQLYLGPFFQLPVDAPELCLAASEEAAFLADPPLHLSASATQCGTFWSCYPKLTQVCDHPADSGSTGPLDTLLTPLLYLNSAVRPAQPLATPAFLLDQQSGLFRDGCWLISAWQPATVDDWLANAAVIQQLITLADEGCTLLETRPDLACYLAGEAPALFISTRAQQTIHVHIALYTPDNMLLDTFECTTTGSSLRQELRLQLPTQTQPGLYRVKVAYRRANGLVTRQDTGFWIWDAALVAAVRGQQLSAGRDFFFQGDQPFPLCGTTYMDSRVQRHFLTLPNPARWDTDFATMQAGGVNVIRTGIWTAWRTFMPEIGIANESALRALDAFVMTACKYSIQVIFTFFTFFPPLFEGENPWLDPRSLAGQQEFVALFARRYAEVALVSWDLINEPSLGDPAKIFALRPIPHYDRFERTAFQQWLASRYTLAELQLRWRLTSADLPCWEQVPLPDSADYNTDPRNTETRNMFKVMDYTLFSQYTFAQWATGMYATIRAAGSPTLIGVGQDEAGARIAPQFYAEAVDYTCTHPWWNIDDLLWDMVLDKTMHTPNLIQETGVMLTRDVDGRPWRSEQECANLLERKLFTSLATRNAGLIQWLWHTNAYMTSENENSIGLLRTDGSAKPELAVMLEFACLMRELQTRRIEAATPPEIWLVIPYSQWFLRPELAVEATRNAVRILGYDFGIIPQAVAEQQLTTLVATAHQPRLIILPALQMLQSDAWQALHKLVTRGATLLVSGVLTRDAHNLPVGTIFTDEDTQNPLPVSRYETLEGIPDTSLQFTFSHQTNSYVRKAHNHVRTSIAGAGKIIWSGLPLELSNTPGAIRRVYQHALNQLPIQQAGHENPVLLVKQTIKQDTLFLLVSESGHEQHITVDDRYKIRVLPNRAGALLIQENGNITSFGGIVL